MIEAIATSLPASGLAATTRRMASSPGLPGARASPCAPQLMSSKRAATRICDQTALKASAARGVVQEGLNTAEALNPAVAISTNVARTVTDRNLDGLPDCNLTDSLANGECGPWLTTGFGNTIPTTTQDPRTLRGWNIRPWNWEFTAGIQHELMPRVSVGMTYYRRVNGGFFVTINTADTAADFTRLPVLSPTDARGGQFRHERSVTTARKHTPGKHGGRVCDREGVSQCAVLHSPEL